MDRTGDERFAIGISWKATLDENAVRLSASPRAHCFVPRLLIGLAAGAVGIDTARVDDRRGSEPSNHRPFCPGGRTLHLEICVGAAGRCAQCALAVAPFRSAARLAPAVA